MQGIADQRLMIQIVASGCMRTRRDAEFIRDLIVRNGWQKDLLPLYRAVLAILGDRSAFSGLGAKERSMAEMCLSKIRRWWIGDSDCRCIRGASGAIAMRMSSCPVHSPSTAEKVFVPGVGLIG